MSKIITSSIWNAQNVPDGLTFDSDLGVFSGTPNLPVGEYVVPVSVTTNYGSDSKDVTILVEEKSYSVFAVGYRASDWSNADEPDENGLYPVDIPNAYKLLPNTEGFIALSSGNNSYFCGANEVLSYIADPYNDTVQVQNTPVLSASKGKIIASVTSLYDGSSSSKLKAAFWVLLNLRNEGLYASTSGRVYYKNGDNTYVNTPVFSGLIDNSNGIILPETPRYRGGTNAFNTGLSWLSDNGYSIKSLVFTQSSGSSTNITYKIKTEEISKAIKIFDSSVFSFLTENKTLDDTSSFFTLGNIKDAWFFGNLGYVLTENNDLYEYYGYFEQVYLGNWPVKKLQMLPFTSETFREGAFMLTDDGELFYKGPALNYLADENLCSGYDSFTRILPNCTIRDMTIANAQNTLTECFTLTVLKE